MYRCSLIFDGQVSVPELAALNKARLAVAPSVEGTVRRVGQCTAAAVLAAVIPIEALAAVIPIEALAAVIPIEALAAVEAVTVGGEAAASGVCSRAVLDWHLAQAVETHFVWVRSQIERTNHPRFRRCCSL